MPIFCAKIFLADFLSNIKVPEFEHKLEPGDLGYNPKTDILLLADLSLSLSYTLHK